MKQEKQENFCPILAVHGYHLNEVGLAKKIEETEIKEANFIKDICLNCPLPKCVFENGDEG